MGSEDMGFKQAIRAGFQKYIDFDTRSSRSEYWFWFLFVFLVSLTLTIIEASLFGFSANSYAPLSALFGLITFIPGISTAVRRLHDTNKSGWWLLIILIPLIGAIVFIVWAATRGTEGPNRFGPDPLQVPEEAME
jgi:uncharacterized membrane protein YhaH (DUF805 family)